MLQEAKGLATYEGLWSLSQDMRCVTGGVTGSKL